MAVEKFDLTSLQEATVAGDNTMLLINTEPLPSLGRQPRKITKANLLTGVGGGGGVSLPADAAGLLFNDGAGNLSWSPNQDLIWENVGGIIQPNGVGANTNPFNIIASGGFYSGKDDGGSGNFSIFRFSPDWELGGCILSIVAGPGATGAEGPTAGYLDLTLSPGQTRLILGQFSGNYDFTILEPTVADGASAVAYLFDTSNLLVDPGALLVAVKNQGTNVFTVGPVIAGVDQYADEATPIVNVASTLTLDATGLWISPSGRLSASTRDYNESLFVEHLATTDDVAASITIGQTTVNALTTGLFVAAYAQANMTSEPVIAISTYLYGFAPATSISRMIGFYAHAPVMVDVGVTNDTSIYFWGEDLAGASTNPYYEWADSRGVRRVKEDNTFNSVGQAIEALYNPQFAKYTPGAANHERVILGQWNSNVAEIGTEKGGTGVLRRTRLIGAGIDVLAGVITGVPLTVDTTAAQVAGNLVAIRNNGTEKAAFDKDGILSIQTVQVVGPRVVDARIDDAISSGDATTDGVIDAIRDALTTHGLIAAA